ncbi:unnamed protein product, partial [marine sediment metagenome]
IAHGSLVPVGWVSAADNRNLLLAYVSKQRRWPRDITVVQSTDGGVSWQKLPIPTARNLDHGTCRGSVIDGRGDSVLMSSGPGCVGVGLPTPRQFLTKYTFCGTGWQRREEPSILDYDIRHCGSAGSVIRLPSGPKRGRIWAAWGTVDRLRRLAVHCKYSDDDGKTWWHAGKGAGVPGSAEAPFTINTYSYQQPRIAYFRGQAAVFWQDSHGLRWSRFEGGRWSTAEVIDPKLRVTLAVSEHESFRV